MNVFNIQNSFKLVKDKGYPESFWAIDLHSTISPPSYISTYNGFTFYPKAKEVLQYLTKRTDIILILFTSSYEKSIDEALKWMESYDIQFNYVNENPMQPNTDLADFSKKFYFNVLLDDKAGFEGKYDWDLVSKELSKIDK